MSKVVKLTPALLKKMVLEEKQKIEKQLRESKEKLTKEPKEVEADEYADTLEMQIDHMKALKIKESQIRKKLTQVKEAQRKVTSRIARQLGK